MYGAKKKSPAKKYGAKSPAKKYGAKTPMAKKKTPMKKPLVGKQKNLPDAIKKAIKAAPTKKKSPAKMVMSMGSAGMVGKAGTAKPPGGPKKTKSTTAKKTGAKKQGYNARLDESLGARNGKKTQSLKARRDESKGAEKSMGRKSYSGNKSSAQGKRVARKR